MGIEVAVRALETHREAPALAGAHGNQRRSLAILIIATAIPGQGNMRRHPGHRLFHIEFEAHAAFQRLRQAGDHTGEFDVAAFERRRQFVGQTQSRKCRRPDEAE
jgi:hypothetical protein